MLAKAYTVDLSLGLKGRFKGAGVMGIGLACSVPCYIMEQGTAALWAGPQVDGTAGWEPLLLSCLC